MAISFLARVLADLLEMDHVDTRKDYPVPGKTTYTFKTTSLFPSLVEAKSKVLSMLDAPVDIPENVSVTEVKRGKLFREYLVEIQVDSGKIGKLSDLLAKKYGILRRRKYSGER
jgi:hypothetical protein